MEVCLKLLLSTLLSDWLTAVLSRDFTLADIVQLHLSATPHPGGFKCFTCEDAEDNYSCNRWAPDKYCPKDSRFCYTRHQMDADGESVSVTKRCVSRDECVSTGCMQDEAHVVCTSCCEGNICNLPVPWNETSATFSTIAPLNRAIGVSPGKITSLKMIIFIMLINVTVYKAIRTEFMPGKWKIIRSSSLTPWDTAPPPHCWAFL